VLEIEQAPCHLGRSAKGPEAQTVARDENPTLALPCRLVFGAGQRPIEVVGPLLEEEATKLREDFWRRGSGRGIKSGLDGQIVGSIRKPGRGRAASYFDQQQGEAYEL
jgi:hypothetical protein